MEEQENNFEAIRALDKALDAIWLNAIFSQPGLGAKLFIDMRDPSEAANWNIFMERLTRR